MTTPLYAIGASGLLAGELFRLVEGHPDLELAGVASRSGGRSLRELHPQLSSKLATCTSGELTAELAASVDGGVPPALVLALPHGDAAGTWRGIRAELGERADAVRVVDLSADYRLADANTYAQWYGQEHPDPEELPRFVYGLCELQNQSLLGRTRVAAPGCFATALQLATLPATSVGMLDPHAPWVLSAVTGSSGSGIAPKAGTHHPHRHGNLWAYGFGGHRHEAELGQALGQHGIAPPIHFLPHSGPFARGIHLTAALPLAEPIEGAAARAAYSEQFGTSPFVEVLQGPTAVPDLRSVVGSNRASIAVHVRGAILNVFVTLDNTIKGGSGQALQCLNLMLGLEESRGLPRAGMGVC